MVIGSPAELTLSRASIPFWRNLASLSFCSDVKFAPVPSLDAHKVSELSSEFILLIKARQLAARPVSVSFSHWSLRLVFFVTG